MAGSVYLNFDITIQRSGDGYRVQVQSPAGEAAITFDNPFSELELENFLLSATPGRRSTRRIDTPEVPPLRGSASACSVRCSAAKCWACCATT